MNPQAFRHKLEQAVEQRDDGLLAELEQIAPDSPVTARIWADHLQIEQAIAQWKALPLDLLHQTGTSTAVAPAVRNSWLPFSAAATRSSAEPRRFGSMKLATALLLGICCGWGAWMFRPQALSQEIVFTASEDESGIVMPVEPVLGAESSLAEFSRQDWNEFTTARSFEAVGSLGAQAEPPMLLAYSAVWAEQGRTFIPVVGMLPHFPEVAFNWEQGVSQTWETLTALPLGVQEAWQRMQQMHPSDATLPVEEVSPFDLLPHEELPRKKIRRPRASNISPFDHAQHLSRIQTLA